MSETKSNQPLSYGQPVSEGDFRTVDYTGPSFNEDAACEWDCRRGWIKPFEESDYEVRCICNPAPLEECDIAA